MFKNVRIGARLAILCAAVAIVSISAVSYLSFQTARESLKAARIAALESIADLKADKIEGFFERLRADVMIIQDYYNIKTNLPIVTRLAADRTDSAYLEAKTMLDGQLLLRALNT